MQNENDLRELAKVMKFMRAISILLGHVVTPAGTVNNKFKCYKSLVAMKRLLN